MKSTATIEVIDRLGALIDYKTAWDFQREIHAEVADGTRPSSLILLEHPDVFTAGKRTQPSDLPWDGSEVIEVDRGGRITWHGPGQLVGYPIVKLPSPVDVMDYVHKLEQAIMDVCASYGIATKKVDDRTGVWVPADSKGPERKIAAIGVRVSAYSRIVPCGISDAGVTSISQEIGREVSITDVKALVVNELLKNLVGWVCD
ncbi:MAG: lipoyl(octanoyl) transferase LipB [Actinobacteria bacterium]|nr:lipoyl(octanoyl) transferase LipB [Actinomycetota bacterium]